MSDHHIAGDEEELIVQQVDSLESEGPACNDRFSMTLKYTVDRGESEGILALQLGDKFKAFEKDLLDAIGPVLCERVRNIRDLESGVDPNARLTPKVGRVQRQKLHTNLVLRKKRSHSRTNLSPLKRCKPLEGRSRTARKSSTGAVCAEVPGEEAYPDSDGGDSDDSDPEDGVVVLEDFTEMVRVDNRDRIGEFYVDALKQIGQTVGKKIIKAWIVVRQPGKQSNNPYNGGLTKEQRAGDLAAQGIDPHNPGKKTAPDWWCTQDNYMKGEGCRHREPDHLRKPERLFFMPIMLRFTGSIKHPQFPSVDVLRKCTEGIEMKPEQCHMLNTMYNVREKEQQYEDGGMGNHILWILRLCPLTVPLDGDACIYIPKPKPQSRPARKKKGESTEPSDWKEPNRERYASIYPLEELAATQSSSAISSLDSSFTSVQSPLIKMEDQHCFECPGSMQAPGFEHQGNPFIDAHGPMLTNPAMDPHDMFAVNAQLGQDAMNTAPLCVIPPYTSRGNECATQPVAFVEENRGRQLAKAMDSRPRRPASVMKHETTSSYPPLWGCSFEHYDFKDDTCTPGGRFRKTQTSAGRPLTGEPIDITSDRYHAHGQPSHVQNRLCAMSGCPNSHSIDRRLPLYMQLDNCARYGCHPSHHDDAYCGHATNQMLQQQGFLPNPYSEDLNGGYATAPLPMQQDELEALMAPNRPFFSLT
ncbi:MAG: hypothetical protein Q9174_002882 [Haloplaca sp. 1 TL-2023]